MLLQLLCVWQTCKSYPPQPISSCSHMHLQQKKIWLNRLTALPDLLKVDCSVPPRSFYFYFFYWIPMVHVQLWRFSDVLKDVTQGFLFASFSSCKVVIFCTKMHNDCDEIPLFTRAESLSGSFSFFMAIFVFASHPASLWKVLFCVALCFSSHDITFVQEFPWVMLLSTFD